MNKTTVIIAGLLALVIIIFLFIPGKSQKTGISHRVYKNDRKTKQETKGSVIKEVSEKINFFRDDDKTEYFALADYKIRKLYADRLYKKFAKRIFTLRDKTEDGTIKNEPHYQRRSRLFNLAKDDPQGLLDAIDAGEFDVNEPTPSNITRGLDVLIITNRFAEAEELIAKGAVPDDDWSDPPYHVAPLIAAFHATPEQIKFTESIGADMEAIDERERNAFSYSIYYAELETAQYLHEKGITAYPSLSGETPLDIALNNNTNTTPEIVEYLFELGFKPCREHLSSISEKNPNYIRLSSMVEKALRE